MQNMNTEEMQEKIEELQSEVDFLKRKLAEIAHKATAVLCGDE